MASRRDLKMGTHMLAIRKVARLAADSALAAAAAAEEEARAAEAEADDRSRLAQGQWAEHVAQGGFSPEYGQALAARLIERDAESRRAALVAERKTELHAARRSDWQEAEARVRLAQRSVRTLRRKLDRRAEESRLAEINDRVTFDWSRR